MEKGLIIKMYDDAFNFFREQVRIFMKMVIAVQRDKKDIPLEILDEYKSNLLYTLDKLGNDLKLIDDTETKYVYTPQIEYNYKYIKDLYSLVTQELKTK